MKCKNSVAIIRTKKDNTEGCHFISTYRFKKLNPTRFAYKEAPVDEFEIYETVGGKVVVKTISKLNHSNVTIENEITISNVANIEILTEYEV